VTRAARALALLGLGALGCSRGSALDGTCRADNDCPTGWECVRASGVCERSSTPLDGFEARDQAIDAAPSDGSGDGASGD
jgi:hypothetical protein